MLVSDGVLPSNEARGYVLRRILRRSIRNLRLLAGGQRGGGGVTPCRARSERFLHELTATAIDALGEQFPELRRDAPRIHGVIDAEEAAFGATLRTGSAIFDAAVGEVKRARCRHPSRRAGVPAARHLRLPDRPHPGDGRRAGPGRGRGGVPAADGGAAPAGQAGLAREEDRQRRHLGARRAARAVRAGALHRVRAGDRGRRRSPACWSAARSVPAAGAGTEVEVVLDRTPFYAEGGGQLADAGVIRVSGSAGWRRRRGRGARRAVPGARA